MKNNLKEYIDYRIERAKQTQHDAETLYNFNSYISAVNRAYYACFYAVTALLSLEDFKYKKHKSVLSLFNKNWLSNNRIDYKTGKIFNVLFDKRHSGDYDDFIIFEKEEVEEWLKQSNTLINAISGWISENIYNRNETGNNPL